MLATDFFDIDCAVILQLLYERLTELVNVGTDVPGVVAACLRPPLYATRFGAGFGTR